MNAMVRAEWLKLMTTRTPRWVLYGTAAAMALGAFLGTAQGPPPWAVVEPLHTSAVWALGSLTIVLLAVITGSHTFTQEFAHDTIAHTVLADPGRRRSMIAKAAVAALAAILVAAVSAAVMATTVYTMALVTGGDVVLHRSDAQALLGLLLAAAAMGVLGVGVGALLRQPLPALVGALLWVFVAENVLGLVAGPVAGFLPGKLAVTLAGGPDGAGGASMVATAAAVAAYAIGTSVVGAYVMGRRDVL